MKNNENISDIIQSRWSHQ